MPIEFSLELVDGGHTVVDLLLVVVVDVLVHLLQRQFRVIKLPTHGSCAHLCCGSVVLCVGLMKTTWLVLSVLLWLYAVFLPKKKEGIAVYVAK